MKTIEHVADIPADFALVTDSQDIRATLEHIGQPEQAHAGGCLFVQSWDGEITAVFQCSSSIPWNGARVWSLL